MSTKSISTKTLPAKIMLVEDEKAIREMLRYALEKSDYEVIEAESAMQARELLQNLRPDLMVVDWMMPSESGVDFTQRLRRDELWQDLPIIMLTARVEESDKVRGLENGADDYMTKPVAIKEFRARIKALLRRALPQQHDESIETAGFKLNLATRQCSVNNQMLKIGGAEYNLLHFFLTHKNKVYSRSQLLDFVWGQGVYIEERTVDVHILRLRKLLKPIGKDQLLTTVRGIGYMFTESYTDDQ